ncbi:hypothetical protein [Tannockella kyphosi]|uniref:hypothetical protein n=1 Tax=Tannockella kyphosi TaxID=2899121 RepID=UPI0020117F68|nr:hypothetical protein [Tannockella kyphosi]
MKLIVGNKSDSHWGIDGDYIKIYKPVYLGNKEKVSEEFSIYSIQYIEMYWKKTQMTGTVTGQLAHIAFFKFVSDTKNYEFPCNTGVSRKELLEAIEYFQRMNIEIRDEYHLIAGFKDPNIGMWEYIDKITKDDKN